MRTNLKKLFTFSCVVVLMVVGLFFILANQNVNPASAASLSEIRYADYNGNLAQRASTSTSEEITFTDRTEEYFETVNSVPYYKQHDDLSNSCGPTAGAILVGFYDKYYEDLIPDFTAYYAASGRYKSNDKVYVPQLMEDLYSLMRCNVDDVGVNETDCLNGLREYCEEKGRDVTYSSISSSSNKVETSKYLSAIQNNQPVILFAAATDLYIISSDSNSDSLVKYTISANHIYVGFGYTEIKYYNGSNNFRTDTYLRVACGRADYTYGFIRVASTASNISNSWLINGYAVSIA